MMNVSGQQEIPNTNENQTYETTYDVISDVIAPIQEDAYEKLGLQSVVCCKENVSPDKGVPSQEHGYDKLDF